MKGRRLAIALALLAGGALGYAGSSTPRLEGTWELTSMKGTAQGKEYVLGDNVKGSQLKTYSGGHFLFVGRFAWEGQERDNFGGGRYALDGEDYTETIIYHAAAGVVGKTLRFKMVVDGDTMTLSGPLSSVDAESLGNQFTEVYKKKD